MELSSDQRRCIEIIEEFAVSDRSELRIGGLAGSGKTHILDLAQSIMERVTGQVAVLAPTNKAARVLESKGVQCSTITSHLKVFVREERTKTGAIRPIFRDKTLLKTPSIIVDEASMVNNTTRAEVLGTCEKCIWVGDFGQLGPVDGCGFMDEGSLDAKLTTNHRQGDGSQIVDFALHFRNGGTIRDWKERPETVFPVTSQLQEADFVGLVEAFKPDVMIAGTNSMVDTVNKLMMRLGGNSNLAPGDVFCAYESCHDTGFYNGETYTIKSINHTSKKLTTECGLSTGFAVFTHNRMPCSSYGTVRIKPAHCITCHKSQGGEWPRVLVINDSKGTGEWCYTSATRASESLCFFEPLGKRVSN